MIEGVLHELREADYAAEVVGHAPNLVFVKLTGFLLPEATCVESKADIVLPLPATFPRAAPYGFFAMTPVTRRSGQWVNTSPGTQPFPTATFFSRKCPTWNETSSGVLTYLAYVNSWLEPRV